jgi:hypothetical protein
MGVSEAAEELRSSGRCEELRPCGEFVRWKGNSASVKLGLFLQSRVKGDEVRVRAIISSPFIKGYENGDRHALTHGMLLAD